jgi:predicted nucleic acid-binding Zn ribbon protein
VALRKLFTPIGVVFKGSGFYSTDHRSPSGQGSSRRTEESDAGGKEGSSKSEPVKPAAETKPAPATDKE